MEWHLASGLRGHGDAEAHQIVWALDRAARLPHKRYPAGTVELVNQNTITTSAVAGLKPGWQARRRRAASFNSAKNVRHYAGTRPTWRSAFVDAGAGCWAGCAAVCRFRRSSSSISSRSVFDCRCEANVSPWLAAPPLDCSCVANVRGEQRSATAQCPLAMLRLPSSDRAMRDLCLILLSAAAAADPLRNAVSMIGCSALCLK